MHPMDLALIIWIGLGVLTAIAAKSRNRNQFGWLILGMIFGIFALAAVLIMPPEAAEPAAKGPTPETHHLCPDCSKLIPKTTRTCPGCGCKLIAEIPPTPEVASANTSSHLDAIAALEKLAGLRDRGLVSPEEFEAKKKQILGV